MLDIKSPCGLEIRDVVNIPNGKNFNMDLHQSRRQEARIRKDSCSYPRDIGDDSLRVTSYCTVPTSP